MKCNRLCTNYVQAFVDGCTQLPDAKEVGRKPLVVPFIWKRTAVAFQSLPDDPRPQGSGLLLLPRNKPLSLRLPAAKAALQDIFLSPEVRSYSPSGSAFASESRATFTYTKKKQGPTQSSGGREDKEESDARPPEDDEDGAGSGAGGEEVTLTCTVPHMYITPAISQTIEFQAVNPANELSHGLFTGGFACTSSSSPDAWLDPDYFTFTGRGNAWCSGALRSRTPPR